MRRQRNSSQMKEKYKATARGPSKTNINNMPDRGFKVMIIRIATGLEKREEGMSETLNPEIRNDIAEIKGSINEMRNMLDGMNSRMEIPEEQISDLEDSIGKKSS